MSAEAGRPLRVVITAPWGERLGGAESFLWTWLRTLDRREVEPLVVFLQPGSFVTGVAGLGIRTAVIPSRRLHNVPAVVSVVVKLARLFRREDPDVILNWASKTQLYGGAAAMLVGMSGRVMWWQHGIADRHWLNRVATLLPARAVGTSGQDAAEAQARLWPRRRVVMVHPGIEDHASAARTSRDAMRRQLGFPLDRPIVGMIGRLQPWKGQDRFLRMLARLVAEGHDVHGVIVGGDAYNLSPEYERDLAELAVELKLTDAVTLAGQTDRARDYLAAMDVLVMPSYGESFGIVVVEALAAGVPVVAVALGGPAEILAGDGGGLLVADGDAGTLATAVARLLRDPTLASSVSRAGRLRYEQRFTAREMARHMATELHLVAAGRGGAAAPR